MDSGEPGKTNRAFKLKRNLQQKKLKATLISSLLGYLASGDSGQVLKVPSLGHLTALIALRLRRQIGNTPNSSAIHPVHQDLPKMAKRVK